MKIFNKALMLFFLSTLAISAFGQKPKMMVVPDDQWCIKRGYYKEFDNMGEMEKYPDYKAVFQDNADMLDMITEVGNIFTQEGINLESLQSLLGRDNTTASQKATLTGKKGGKASSSPYDQLMERSQADILLKLRFDEERKNGKPVIRFNLTAVDAYSGEQVSGSTGDGTPSTSASKIDQLQEAVLSFKDQLLTDILRYFNDIVTNGRNVTLSVWVDETCPIDLEEEFDGVELRELITQWMEENTVNGKFEDDYSSENEANYVNVRVPAFKDNGKSGYQAKDLAIKLVAFLNEKTGINSRYRYKGKGSAIVLFGGK